MLTFSFTGAEGSMTESDVLTSGMVGKEILLTFDESWENLTKTLVFQAGEVTRVADYAQNNTIPADVLRIPFCRLYVGVYGTDAAGTLVIPTVMAEGPLIRHGADPIQDGTAWELPVWDNLQSQIGNISTLETSAKSDLVAAVNELHRRLRMLEVDAPRTPAAYWDFRTGSLFDQITGLEAVVSGEVTLDASGAHTHSSSSYITLPLGRSGATLAGHYIEIKFGAMTLTDTGATMRLATGNAGNQPASAGLMWSTRDCWTHKLTETTDFTDLQMFSGKTLTGRPSSDGTQILWYIENQYICPSDPGYAPTHVSLGCSVNAAYPLVVETVKIFPN